MTDAQMLQNLLAVYETMVAFDSGIGRFVGGLPKLKEVIAALRRRIALEDTK